MNKSNYALLVVILAGMLVTSCRITGGARSSRSSSSYTYAWTASEQKHMVVKFDGVSAKRYAVDVALNRQGYEPAGILWRQFRGLGLIFFNKSPKKSGRLYPSIRYRIFAEDGVTMLGESIYTYHKSSPESRSVTAGFCPPAGGSCGFPSFDLYSDKIQSHSTKPVHLLATCDTAHMVCKKRYILEVRLDKLLPDLSEEENRALALHNFNVSVSSVGPSVRKILPNKPKMPPGYGFSVNISEFQ